MANELTTRKWIELNNVDVDWFNEHYTGSHLNWILSLLLEEFRKSHSLTPTDYAAIAAKSLEEKIADGYT